MIIAIYIILYLLVGCLGVAIGKHVFDKPIDLGPESSIETGIMVLVWPILALIGGVILVLFLISQFTRLIKSLLDKTK